VERITPELKQAVEGKSPLGRGGMKTKIQAAEIATQSGIPVVIANSFKENVLLDILEQRSIGTRFKPVDSMSSMKKWIAYGASLKGGIFVNDGAKTAIMKNASLLPIGIDLITGQFEIGDVVSLIGPDGKRFGRGMVNYSSAEVNMIKGLQTRQVSKVLGYIRQKEVVTRKHLHLEVREE
ncbi:MAG: glutamate 5-kinase, partial [Candidatus Bathyarchaeota archaeon]